MHEQRLKFGSEVKLAVSFGEIQRLDAKTVASQHQSPVEMRPQRHREHTSQAGKTFGVPLDERMEQDFRISAGAEPVSQALQLASQLPVVVDFSVESDGHAAILSGHRLVARRDVENRQTRRAQRDNGRFEDALMIGSSMYQRVHRAKNARAVRDVVFMCKAGYATQVVLVSSQTVGPG